MPPPHYAITMCNDLIYLLPPPCISFYSIPYYHLLHSVYTIICFNYYYYYYYFVYLYLFFFILILFLLSVCRCCLCELEAYDTKTNSLYAQAYLAIKALSDSDSEESV